MFSILPSIASNCLNFQDNLDFKDEIVAKYLLRSRFFSIYNKMKIKQEINIEAIQQVCYLHYAFFIPLTCFTLCQSCSFTYLVLFTKNYKLQNKRKEDLLCIWLIQHITLYQMRQANGSLETIAFSGTCVCINNPYLQNSFVKILYSYLRYTDTFMDVPRCNIIRAS